MSADFSLRSPAHIEWQEFSDHLHSVLPHWGIAETDSNSAQKSAWFRQDGTGIEFLFGLTLLGDDVGFLVQQARDDLGIPFETLITVSAYAKPLEKANRLTLEIVCAIAEKWPIVVDNGGADEPMAYYDNDALFQRLKNGQGLFR